MSPVLSSTVVPLSEVPFANTFILGGVREPFVLVVDDDQLVADTLSIVFKRAGYNVRTAYDGEGALAIASVEQPDILVTDVNMPFMNGVDLAMTLLQTAPECKVLLFCGLAALADLTEARAAGYDFPIQIKPVHPTELLQNVANILGDGWALPTPLVPAAIVAPETGSVAGYSFLRVG